MLKRLRENKSAQGTLLASPTMLWMLALLIIPLLLTLVVSFGKRSPDGEVIFSFSLANYIRLLGFSTKCDNGACCLFQFALCTNSLALVVSGIQHNRMGDCAGISACLFHRTRQSEEGGIPTCSWC